MLNAADLAASTGYEAFTLGLCGVAGWMSDSAAITTYGLSANINFRAPLAAHRLYTTATSITLFAQQNTGTGVTGTNLPQLHRPSWMGCSLRP